MIDDATTELGISDSAGVPRGCPPERGCFVADAGATLKTPDGDFAKQLVHGVYLDNAGIRHSAYLKLFASARYCKLESEYLARVNERGAGPRLYISEANQILETERARASDGTPLRASRYGGALCIEDVGTSLFDILRYEKPIPRFDVPQNADGYNPNAPDREPTVAERSALWLDGPDRDNPDPGFRREAEAKILFDLLWQIDVLMGGNDPIYHGDIKLANICVAAWGTRGRDLRATIIDFEAGRMAESNEGSRPYTKTYRDLVPYCENDPAAYDIGCCCLVHHLVHTRLAVPPSTFDPTLFDGMFTSDIFHYEQNRCGGTFDPRYDLLVLHEAVDRIGAHLGLARTSALDQAGVFADGRRRTHAILPETGWLDRRAIIALTAAASIAESPGHMQETSMSALLISDDGARSDLQDGITLFDSISRLVKCQQTIHVATATSTRELLAHLSQSDFDAILLILGDEGAPVSSLKLLSLLSDTGVDAMTTVLTKQREDDYDGQKGAIERTRRVSNAFPNVAFLTYWTSLEVELLLGMMLQTARPTPINGGAAADHTAAADAVGLKAYRTAMRGIEYLRSQGIEILQPETRQHPLPAGDAGDATATKTASIQLQADRFIEHVSSRHLSEMLRGLHDLMDPKRRVSEAKDAEDIVAIALAAEAFRLRPYGELSSEPYEAALRIAAELEADVPSNTDFIQTDVREAFGLFLSQSLHKSDEAAYWLDGALSSYRQHRHTDPSLYQRRIARIMLSIAANERLRSAEGNMHDVIKLLAEVLDVAAPLLFHYEPDVDKRCRGMFLTPFNAWDVCSKAIVLAAESAATREDRATAISWTRDALETASLKTPTPPSPIHFARLLNSLGILLTAEHEYFEAFEALAQASGILITCRAHDEDWDDEDARNSRNMAEVRHALGR